MTRDQDFRPTGQLITDKALVAATEARNALLQFDRVLELVRERKRALALTSRDVCQLQAIAVRDIFADAGEYRKISVEISNSPHQPPPSTDVPRLVDEMCEYANSVADKPVHVSAYLMWRCNWIHSFADGNGRTSRAVSYLAMCCGLGMELPGTVTVPDLIVQNRILYYRALDSADAAWNRGVLDVSDMELLLIGLLTQQLKSTIA